MFVPARPRRFALIVPAVLVAALAACAGPDLSKQNFPRTTVPVPTSANDNQIDDVSVSLSALRTIDPCALIDNAALAGLGAGEGPSEFDLDRCTNVVHDAGGKRLQADLQLGDIVVGVENESGTVGGLPLIVDKLDDSSCDVTAVTSRSPDLGITVSATYAGGDACGAGQTVLEKVLAKIHDNPAQLDRPAGSAIGVDLCAVPDDAVMTDVLGRGTGKEAAGLHRCEWSGGNANGYLTLDEAAIPSAGDGFTAVALGGITGYQKLETDAGKRCTVTWLQRPTQDGNGEVVSAEYDNFHDDAGQDDACGKAVKIARSAVPKLPHA